MKKEFGKAAIATAAFACATLISVDWSVQQGVSLSVESAQARVGRPLTPVSVAGVARRQNRRAAYGYGYGAGVVGAGLAAGAVAAAATSPWGWGYSQPYYGDSYAYAGTGRTWTGGYYANSPWGYYECQIPHAYDCQPHSNIGWYR